MAHFCSFCYVEFDELCAYVTCNKCLVRKYCSLKCRRADSSSGHKQWCGKAGEINIDYEVRETEGTSLGVFALRKFEVGEIVMAEGDIFQSRTICPAEQFAIINLDQPDVNEKDSQNSNGLRAYGPRNCVTMAKVNHHCIGNSEVVPINSQGVKILKTLRSIEEGAEITFNYINCMLPSAIKLMPQMRNITCTCSACGNKATAKKLHTVKSLYVQLFGCMTCQQHDILLSVGDQLLYLSAEMNLGHQLHLRVCYALFQVAIQRRATLVQALSYMQLLVETLKKTFGDLELPELAYYVQLARDVTTHPLYCAADRKVLLM